jgi:hypothetical protein
VITQYLTAAGEVVVSEPLYFGDAR